MVKIRNMFVSFAVLLIGLCASVAEIYADIHMAASASYADVSAAVSVAASGDTVKVPAGTSTWDSTLVITKSLFLQGAGVGSTIITTSMNNTITWTVNGNKTLEFSGFEIDGNDTAAGGSSTKAIFLLINTSQTVAARVKIYNNKIRDLASGSGTVFKQMGEIRGVIYSNEFINTPAVLRSVGSPATCQGWVNFAPFNYGNEMGVEYGHENLYLEDNTISCTKDVQGWGWIESGQGSRYAIRYNTYDLGSCGTSSYNELWDIHNNNGSGNSASPGCEIYGNQILNIPRGGRIVAQRDGECLVYNNAFDRSSIDVHLTPQSGTDGCDAWWDKWITCDSPVMHINNTYYWNNETQGTEKAPTLVNPNYCSNSEPDDLDENEDWWDYNASCSGSGDCATGIGIGASAPTGTCTTGVAYWVTSASPATTATQDPFIIQTSTLYKCTSTDTWEVFYTPYEYPHPLRSGSSIVKPKLPVNLQGSQNEE